MFMFFKKGKPRFSRPHFLNVTIEATTRKEGVGPRPRPGSRPASFPEMRNSVLFWLSLVLRDAEIICIHVNLFESAFNRPCHVFVRLGPALTPTSEELCEWYFNKVMLLNFDKVLPCLFWKSIFWSMNDDPYFVYRVLTLFWMTNLEKSVRVRGL